jgi:hypothetical protein
MRKSRQENDLNSGFCSNSFTFSFSSSICLSNLGGTVDNSEKYANHISSSILFSGLSLLDSRREFTKFQYSFWLFDWKVSSLSIICCLNCFFLYFLSLAYSLLILKNDPLINGSWGYFDSKKPLSLTRDFWTQILKINLIAF